MNDPRTAFIKLMGEVYILSSQMVFKKVGDYAPIDVVIELSKSEQNALNEIAFIYSCQFCYAEHLSSWTIQVIADNTARRLN